MSKIIVTEFLSLDGVMEEPFPWTSPYWTEEIAKFKQDELFASDAHLLGRITYEGFAAAWPGRTDEQGFADRMNSLPKYVVSTTLKETDWQNSHIIGTNIFSEIARLKQVPGQDILVAGSATLVNTLVSQDLVDGLHLLVYPVILGSGKRLFEDGSKVSLKLAEARYFTSGVVLLRYQKDGN